jgi:hypothetical protein
MENYGYIERVLVALGWLPASIPDVNSFCSMYDACIKCMSQCVDRTIPADFSQNAAMKDERGCSMYDLHEARCNVGIVIYNTPCTLNECTDYERSLRKVLEMELWKRQCPENWVEFGPNEDCGIQNFRTWKGWSKDDTVIIRFCPSTERIVESSQPPTREDENIHSSEVVKILRESPEKNFNLILPTLDVDGDVGKLVKCGGIHIINTAPDNIEIRTNYDGICKFLAISPLRYVFLNHDAEVCV